MATVIAMRHASQASVFMATKSRTRHTAVVFCFPRLLMLPCLADMHLQLHPLLQELITPKWRIIARPCQVSLRTMRDNDWVSSTKHHASLQHPDTCSNACHNKYMTLQHEYSNLLTLLCPWLNTLCVILHRGSIPQGVCCAGV